MNIKMYDLFCNVVIGSNLHIVVVATVAATVAAMVAATIVHVRCVAYLSE